MCIYMCVCAWIPFFQAQDAVGSRPCHDTTDAELGQDFEMHPTVWNLELELSSASEFKHVQKCLGTQNRDGGNQPEVRAATPLQHNISRK